MTTYITGYDGSDAARAALRFTRRLAETSHAEVIAAAVYPQTPWVFGKGASDAPLAELDEQARADAQSTLESVDVPDVTHVAVGAPSPAEGLHRLAEDQHASLITVGASHRGVVGRTFLGSVAEHLLHGATCPVAVVPAAYDEAPIQTVAVAYDERPQSAAALTAAEELARELHARLVILAVYEPMATPYVGAGVIDTDAPLDKKLEVGLRDKVQGLADGVVGIEAEGRVVTGRAMTALVKAATDVDLLVMGSRGYGPARGVLLGSVSRYVVDHAPCPVVVMPRGMASDVLEKPAAVAGTSS